MSITILNGLDLRVAVEETTAATGRARCGVGGWFDIGLVATEKSGFWGRMVGGCCDCLGGLLVLGSEERHCDGLGGVGG